MPLSTPKSIGLMTLASMFRKKPFLVTFLAAFAGTAYLAMKKKGAAVLTHTR